MKKKILFCILMLATLAVSANPVGVDRASRVAQNAVAYLCAERHGLDTKQPIELTYVSPALGFNLVHVYNYRYGDIKGFIIVSGDDLTDPILAFSDEGELDSSGPFDNQHLVKNPAFVQQLCHYSEEIKNAREAKASAPAHVTHKWQTLENEPLLPKGDFYNDQIRQLLGSMNWGQGKPYNCKCPGPGKAVTGCVATAFGMIMNYWDYPEHGFGQHSYNGENNPAAYPDWRYGELSADFQNTYYDWDHMPNSLDLTSDNASKNAVGTLLFHIGVALDMRYGEEASGCWSLPEYAIFDTSLHLSPLISAPYRLSKHFGYKYSYAGMRDSIGDDTLWLQMLYNSLVDSMPIYYAGWAKDSSAAGHSATSGHGYIIDGYFSDEVDSNFFHINWGWNGNANGFFKIDAMRPSSYDFTQWHGAVIGFQPDTSYHGYDPLAITSVDNSIPRVYTLNGSIVTENIANQPAAIFDIMGRCVATRTANQSDKWTITVRPGIYIIKVGQQAGQKVIVIK